MGCWTIIFRGPLWSEMSGWRALSWQVGWGLQDRWEPVNREVALRRRKSGWMTSGRGRFVEMTGLGGPQKPGLSQTRPQSCIAGGGESRRWGLFASLVRPLVLPAMAGWCRKGWSPARSAGCLLGAGFLAHRGFKATAASPLRATGRIR